MFHLPIFLSMCLSWAMCNTGVILQERLTLSVITEKPFKGESGYYFSMALTPLSQNEYVFVATPLKKAYFIIDGQQIIAGHTMTIKERKGFTDYFSGEKYNAKLSIRDESKSDGGITDYRGVLEIWSGSENRKFKIHGRLYQ